METSLGGDSRLVELATQTTDWHVPAELCAPTLPLAAYSLLVAHRQEEKRAREEGTEEWSILFQSAAWSHQPEEETGGKEVMSSLLLLMLGAVAVVKRTLTCELTKLGV